MSIDDFREKNAEQLAEELVELRKQQIKFKFQKALGKMNQTHLQRETRRQIARIKTVLKERVKRA